MKYLLETGGDDGDGGGGDDGGGVGGFLAGLGAAVTMEILRIIRIMREIIIEKIMTIKMISIEKILTIQFPK